ncbi:hypothetical protein KC921_00330 [Candidatus Woesebacteria bacterium]|nr:hypothetical protein [Candidatus Woesebacteria bacterium]
MSRKTTPSFLENKPMLYLVGGLLLGLFVVMVGYLLVKQNQNSLNTEEVSTIPKIGYQLNQGATELPLAQEYDQEVLYDANQDAWDELIEKAPTNVTIHPSDERLLAIVLPKTETSDQQTLMAYKHRPVVINTMPVDTLPNGETSEFTVTAQNYQLVIDYSFTPAVTSLDIPQILNAGFDRLLEQTQPSLGEQPQPIKAFSRLLK